MKVMGLDLSLTSTGLVVLTPDNVYSEALKSNLKAEGRLVDLCRQVRSRMGEHVPNLVVLEGYSFMSSGRGMTGLAELGGVIKSFLWANGHLFIIVPPARVKKFACGKGNAKKDQVRLEVFKRWGFEAKTNDEVDAYVLARIGLAYLGHEVDKLIKPQREVIEDLQNGV